jgi:hypothetical protein
MVIDIGGAFLHVKLDPTGEKIIMQLNQLLTTFLVQLDPTYEQFVEPDGTCYVQLDRALYGIVQAAELWYQHLRKTLIDDGFTPNPYDVCTFNKFGEDGKQITVVVHVDDLLVTCETTATLEAFHEHLKSVYKETTMKTGDVLDYVGMTFDFSEEGQVRITMDGCIKGIVEVSGVTAEKVTPATSTLFDVRDAPKATAAEAKRFHSLTMKLLYLAKRSRPEILTAVSFLCTRVHECDEDDLAKLERVIGYLVHTPGRGIVLRIGEAMEVNAYIDASYGVHQTSGRSHSGCALVIGGRGPVYVKSAKQGHVTKSSTEAELVALSDLAGQAILLRNFIRAQGYDIGPAILYQDNKSCLALMKRGGPTSSGSRHINIRHFWLVERKEQGEVIFEHLGTEHMRSNILTKPVQGSQFQKEREDLTGWEGW